MRNLIGAWICILGCCGVAHATTFNTANGATLAGLPENASATFTTGPGTITIVITNLEADPTGDIQFVSSLQFALSGIASPSGTLTSSSAVQITALTNSSYTLSSGPLSTNWGVTSTSGDLLLSAAYPKNMLAGPPSTTTNEYTSANGSIKTGSHIPDLYETVTFNLSVTGVTSLTNISSVVFGYGSAAGDGSLTGVITTPEPGTDVMLGSGLLALGFFSLKIRKSGAKRGRT